MNTTALKRRLPVDNERTKNRNDLCKLHLDTPRHDSDLSSPRQIVGKSTVSQGTLKTGTGTFKELNTRHGCKLFHGIVVQGAGEERRPPRTKNPQKGLKRLGPKGKTNQQVGK